ncbi:two-component response regulator ORR24-like [Amaranthus tricolor]|uniref:two-component response regulator ORR24-like n=1 Tax=Amaranthus tricolor TaxID=29722 RepID=UPI00258EA034|nr:two-component response regulator ORR24-like [Amaranthus tricolor]
MQLAQYLWRYLSYPGDTYGAEIKMSIVEVKFCGLTSGGFNFIMFGLRVFVYHKRGGSISVYNLVDLVLETRKDGSVLKLKDSDLRQTGRRVRRKMKDGDGIGSVGSRKIGKKCVVRSLSFRALKMSLQNERFPVGLRVLVVDDDVTCLKLMDNLLKKCQYKVTTTNQAREALRMLHENRNRFDIVITDVEMPDMDGIRLLQLVGLEMNLPVIMLSAYSDTKRVMQGIRNGACDYLVKPVRIQELQNIWQHVVRRNKSMPVQRITGGSTRAVTLNVTQGAIHRGKSIEDSSGDENNDDDEIEESGRENEDSSTQKKPRLFWSVDLHQKFVDAVNQLGLDKAFPKKILELMNVEGLTREKVASHLQKYRLYLKKVNSGPSVGNRLNSFGAEDAQIGPLGGGYGIYRSLAGPGRFPSLPDQGGAMLSRMNTAAGLSFRGLSSSPMLQTSQLPLGFTANPNTNLFQGVPTTIQMNKASFPNPQTTAMMFNGSPLFNARDFGNQSSFVSPASNQGAFGIGGGTNNFTDNSGKGNWGTSVQPAAPLLSVRSNMLLTNAPSNVIVPANAPIQNLQDDPLDVFCGISSLDNSNNLGQQQMWQGQNPEYILNCNNSSVSATPIAGENARQSNASPFNHLEGASSNRLQQNEVPKSNDGSNLKFDENFLLDDPKVICGSTQSSSDYLQDIVGSCLKKVHTALIFLLFVSCCFLH